MLSNNSQIHLINRMKSLCHIVVLMLLAVSCSNKNSNTSMVVNDHSISWENYTCEWFDFDYPAFMQVEKSRNEISDTIPGLKEGGDVFVYGDYLPYRFRFTKSCMFNVFDNPEKWRDFSIETKLGGLSDDSMNYLGIYDEQDSIDFKGNPAASVTFAVLDGADTIVHHQIVVMKMPSKNLYYLNVMAPKEDFNNYEDLIDSVFNSIVLK